MVDAGGLIALGASAPLALKVLGPTADYVGGELQQWTERRHENVRRIFEAAARKLDEEELEQPGQVPPRVLKEILAQGSYCDDELGAEYFGGVLASSRTEMSRDDRSAALAALIGRLSAYQLRTHYVLYEHARRLLNPRSIEIGLDAIRREEGRIFIPYSAWEAGMAFDPVEGGQAGEILQHTLFGLMREDLLEEEYASAEREVLAHTYKRNFPSGGLVYTISMHGIELFNKAHGVSGEFIDTTFVSPDPGFAIGIEIEIGGGSSRLVDLPGLDKKPDKGWG